MGLVPELLWRYLVQVRRTELRWGILVASIFACFAFSQRWVHDDGFINLRIVRNIVDGLGPVFNRGERVEAGTSPLWLALLALLHALHAPLEWTAVLLGIGCMTCAVALMPFVPVPIAVRDSSRPSRTLPVGILVFAAVPAAWNYASAGLETGLACLWIVGAALLATRFARAETVSRKLYWAPFVAGLGPLIRPDFFVYSALFLLIMAIRVRRLRSIVLLGACAAVLPALVQVARMGYFGTLAPNTALAKEAFRLNVTQGVCYLKNFTQTYLLVVPLVALTGLALIANVERWKDGRFGVFVSIVPMLGAVIHASYLVVIGGDYMHARLLLPDLIAFAAPVALFRFSVPKPRDLETLWQGAAGVVTVGWAVLCVVALRPGKENVCAIGDEHGWYTRLAENSRPVHVTDYQRHPFFKERKRGLGGGRVLAYETSNFKLAESVDGRVERGLFAGAIGIVGYSLPSSVFLIDKHGLADPIVARFEVLERGRPGHEKTFTQSWVLARFGEPRSDDSSEVRAARHALSCGPLGELVQAVSAPLTASRFLRNLTVARTNHALRIPIEPFEAEAKFCGGSITRAVQGGAGGEPFSSRCSSAAPVAGLRVTRAENDNAVASVALACGATRALDSVFGEDQGSPVLLTCPPAAELVGFYGDADNLLRRVGLLCRSTDGNVLQTQSVGGVGRMPFDVRCPSGTQLGITGRSGSLVDAFGVMCTLDAR